MNNIKRDFIKWANEALNVKVKEKDISVEEIWVNDEPEQNVVIINEMGKEYFEIMDNKKFSFIDAKPW